MRIVTYVIKYLGKFEFIFETILDYESGDQMGSFDKKPPSKISCLGTFKAMWSYSCLKFLGVIYVCPLQPEIGLIFLVYK
jgi:hypothetical protein